MFSAVFKRAASTVASNVRIVTLQSASATSRSIPTSKKITVVAASVITAGLAAEVVSEIK
ncbi:hypothetical protein HDU97_000718 [Phlyctochytrium planicorne]|nr:hypothetical protein HDU97_000718 [Phlyctochytrium planicorne]